MTPQRPASIGDINWVRGDALPLRLYFHVPDSETGVDVSGSVFSVRVYDDDDNELVDPEVITTSASAGVVRIAFTADEVDELPRYAHLAIAEIGRWDRTVLIGRLMESLAIGGTYSDPQIEDSVEVNIPIAVMPSAIGSGTTWESLGAIIWDDLGSITWENI